MRSLFSPVNNARTVHGARESRLRPSVRRTLPAFCTDTDAFHAAHQSSDGLVPTPGCVCLIRGKLARQTILMVKLAVDWGDLPQSVSDPVVGARMTMGKRRGRSRCANW